MIDIQQFPTKVCDALPHWRFDPVTVGKYQSDPNSWIIDRCGDVDVFIITDERGFVIDDPNDKGQDVFALVLHGIGWLHANVR